MQIENEAGCISNEFISSARDRNIAFNVSLFDQVPFLHWTGRFLSHRVWIYLKKKKKERERRKEEKEEEEERKKKEVGR